MGGTLTGAELDSSTTTQLAAALPTTTIFARVTPEQKSRIIRLQRALGDDVGFLGDGVNDAVALHDADVGISVRPATDVAKDAADIVLLDKDLGDPRRRRRRGAAHLRQHDQVRPDGRRRRTSATCSAPAGASLFLSFLPMLPSQILLNNLLYDVERDDDPDRQRRRGAARAAGALGHRASSAAS